MHFHEEERTWYETAQICLNGHEINQSATSSPEFSADFCQKCGAKTIQECPACRTLIRGYCHIPGVVSLGDFEVPAHCHSCGEQYPWMGARIRAAKELSDELDILSTEEKEQ